MRAGASRFARACASRLARTLVAVSSAFAPYALAQPVLTPSEANGRLIYHEGRSGTGGAIYARVGASQAPIPASAVPCANCHGADGRGRPEGGVLPPDITWAHLGRADGHRHPRGRTHGPYDEASLGRTIEHGLDPAGNVLDTAMPRFTMSMSDRRDLAAYLKKLEHDRDPGVLEDTLRVGTMLPDAGPLAERARTVAALLEAMAAEVNDAGGIHGRRIELVNTDPGPDAATATAAWQEVVEARRVFCIVAPFVPQLDETMGGLAESARMPLIGPLFRMHAGETQRYRFDALSGLREELVALASFAEGLRSQGSRAAIVHPAPSAALAREVAGRLERHGWSVRLVPNEAGAFAADRIASSLAEGPADAVFFVGRENDFGALALALDARSQRPHLLAAASQVGAGAALELPAGFSRRVYLAYPTSPSDRTPGGVAHLQALRQRAGLDGRYAALQVSAYAAASIAFEGLKRAGRDASREKLVDALEDLRDFRTGLTPPMAFEAGRRVGAPGAHIVAVDLERRNFLAAAPWVRVDAARDPQAVR